MTRPARTPIPKWTGRNVTRGHGGNGVGGGAARRIQATRKPRPVEQRIGWEQESSPVKNRNCMCCEISFDHARKYPRRERDQLPGGRYVVSDKRTDWQVTHSLPPQWTPRLLSRSVTSELEAQTDGHELSRGKRPQVLPAA